MEKPSPQPMKRKENDMAHWLASPSMCGKPNVADAEDPAPSLHLDLGAGGSLPHALLAKASASSATFLPFPQTTPATLQ